MCRYIVALFLLIFLHEAHSSRQLNNNKQTQAYNTTLKDPLTEIEKNWLKENTVVLGASTDWAPFDLIDNQGNYTGMTPELFNEVAKITGMKYEVAFSSWTDNIKKLTDGEISILGSSRYSDERTEFAFYSDPYFEVLEYFFVHEEINISSIEDLNGKTVAIPTNYITKNILVEHFPEIKILEVISPQAAVDAVLERKADILYGSYSAFIHLINKVGINTIKPLQSTRHLGKSYIHFISTKKQSILHSIIQKGLKSIPTSFHNQLMNKWVSEFNQTNIDQIPLTNEEKIWLNNNPKINIVGDPNWLPYEAKSDDGQYIGIVNDYLILIEQKLGFHFEFIPTNTWQESIQLIQSGKADLISETMDSQLKQTLSFTEPYLESPIVIVMRDSESFVESIEQLAQRKIGLISDYGYTNTIINHYSQQSFELVDNIQIGLTKVSTGELDGLVATLAQATYQIAEKGIGNLRIVGKTQFKTELAFAISPNKKILTSILNKALNAINTTERKRIFDRWTQSKFAVQTDYTIAIFITIFSFTFITFIFIWNRRLKDEVSKRIELEAQTKTLIDNIPLQLIVTDKNSNIINANPQAKKDYGITSKQIGSINTKFLYASKKDAEYIERKLLEKGRVEQKIVSVNYIDQSTHSMLVSIIPIRYDRKDARLSIAIDLTERLKMEQDLKVARKQAEAANLAKSAFLANMSHEIRTPMNAIIGFTELLAERLSDNRSKSYIKTIQNSGRSLLCLINEILDLSKVEAGKLEIDRHPTNVNHLISEVVEIFITELRNKDLDVIINIQDNLPEALLLDPLRTRQILFNLIGNAVKFTSKGTITIKVEQQQKSEDCLSQLIISVKDTGIGISSDQLDNIFRSFQQSEGQDINKYGGTGLGLTISQKLAQLMNGNILVSSIKDEGSNFSLVLKDIKIVDNQSVNKQKEISNDKEIRFNRSKILVVDDIDENRFLIDEFVRDFNITVDMAVNGEQAIQKANSKDYDLILMDIRMPVLNGYEAAKIIKKNKPNCPIVALTASVMIDEHERMMRSHFEGYLRKPFLKKELISELKKYLTYKEIESNNNGTNGLLSGLTFNDNDNRTIISIGFKTELEKAIQSKNIDQINQLTMQLLDKSKALKEESLSSFAIQLKESIECFDITAIEQLLNQLKNSLEEKTSLN